MLLNIERNSGAGFASIAKAYAFMDQSATINNSATITHQVELTAGDIIKGTAQDEFGASGYDTIGNTVRLKVKKV